MTGEQLATLVLMFLLGVLAATLWFSLLCKIHIDAQREREQAREQ